MDPTATLEIANSKTAGVVERVAALYHLHTWLERGGCVPDGHLRLDAQQRAITEVTQLVTEIVHHTRTKGNES